MLAMTLAPGATGTIGVLVVVVVVGFLVVAMVAVCVMMMVVVMVLVVVVVPVTFVVPVMLVLMPVMVVVPVVSPRKPSCGMAVLALVAGGLSPVLEALVSQRTVAANVDMSVMDTVVARLRLAARVLLMRRTPRSAPVFSSVGDVAIALAVVGNAPRTLVRVVGAGTRNQERQAGEEDTG